MELGAALAHDNIPPLLIKKLKFLSFEGRKDVGVVLSRVLKMETEHKTSKVAQTIASDPSLIALLISGYDTDDTCMSLNCGVLLREFAVTPKLGSLLVECPDLFKFFKYVEHESFESSADAFASFSAALTSDKAAVAKMLLGNYDAFFSQYNQLLKYALTPFTCCPACADR